METSGEEESRIIIRSIGDAPNSPVRGNAPNENVLFIVTDTAKLQKRLPAKNSCFCTENKNSKKEERHAKMKIID